MSRAPLSVDDVAHDLGLSTATVERVQRSALAKLRAAYCAPGAGPERTVTLTMTEIALIHSHVAHRSYLVRLMRCRPGEEPEGDPPSGL